MKKSHLIILALSLAIFAPLAYAAFSDVKSSSIFYDAISYVQSQQIVEGYSDGTYKPDININRAEFTKIIINAVYSSSVIDECLQNETEPTNEAAFFPDVPKTEWFAKYVCVAKVNGIIQGYPDGTFKPADDIKFVEAAKIIVNGFKYQTSADAIWYAPFVIELGNRHAIPTSIITFEKLISRGEMAEMIYRLKAEVTDKESLTYEDIASGAAAANNGSVQGANLNLMLFFGKYAENLATESFPVHASGCFTDNGACQTRQLYPDEWTLNTKDRLAFDTPRNKIVFPMAAGVFQLNFFHTNTITTTSPGLEDKYAASYQPAIMDNILAATVFTADVKETVIKYNLVTDKEVAVTGFSSYENCNWPAVSADQKVWAVCKNAADYKIVDENNTELYSSANELASLAADRDNFYFVEKSEIKKINLTTKEVDTVEIPAENKAVTVTASPFGDYIGGKAQKGGKWIVFIFKPSDKSFVVQAELDNEPGTPVFGPYL